MRNRLHHPSKHLRQWAKRCLVSFVLSLLAFVFAQRAQASVTDARLLNTTVPFEAGGLPNGVTIQFTLDTPGSVQIDIDDLNSTTENHTGISQAGLAAGTYQIPWNALWALGSDLGRKDGLYRIRVTQAAANTFVIGTLLNITSVDIHYVSVTPSFDAGGNPAFPFLIKYSLAKNSLVSVQVKDSLGNMVRTLAASAPQLGESLFPTITLQWDGLDDNNRPVALGVYSVTIDARDSTSADVATQRVRTVAVTSLASLNSNLQQLFETNTYVYPHPVVNGLATFHSLAVRNNASISLKVYTIAGDLVLDKTFPGLATAQVVNYAWNAENQSGKKLGRGMYFLVVREDDPAGSVQTVLKVAVIP